MKRRGGKTKGSIKTGGRKKGSTNLVTADIKERFKLFVENNLDNIQTDYDTLRMENPKAALDFMKDLAEFVVPKLARTELTGKDGDSIKVATNIIVDDKNNADILTNI
jgi:hypothetical protein